MYNNGIEEGESPEDCQTQDHEVNKKGHDNVFEKYGVFPDKFTSSKRIEKPLGKIG
jgi:hypothetical protein